MQKSLAIGLTVLFLGGCAIGVKHDYQGPLELDVSTSAPVAVATLDQRPYVVSGQKGPDFVGLSRGGFGNPFDVTTQSGKPLAADMSNAIVSSMKSKGVDARMVELKPGLADGQAISELRAGGAHKAVLLTLREWKGDTMVNVGFAYDMDLRIFDRSGNPLVSKVQQGKENLGAGTPFSPGGGDQVLPRYRRMMELLFRDPDVVKALQP